MTSMHFIGLDIHKKTISYCVKDAAGHVYREGKIGSTRRGQVRINAAATSRSLRLER